ncbi:Amino acid transporter, transmembrane [Nannochloropsis gaditana]|uniref:Amino acid transporter, transmembrane n=1 Tax=Nannochloropsis gaditana TaxID=72520 RepID=W7T836_9STRA|nr:Amino acid transporter, transmembrane [Nannochloropsis gaditana]
MSRQFRAALFVLLLVSSLLTFVSATPSSSRSAGNGNSPRLQKDSYIIKKSRDGASSTLPRRKSRALFAGIRGGGVGGSQPPAPVAPPPGTSSSVASMVNLAKNIIGGGMLALPAGLAAGAGTGYIPAYLLLAFSAVSSAYTFVLVGRSVEATRSRSFKEAWSRTVGPAHAWVVDYAITALAFAVCIVYACFVGDTFTSLLKGAGLPAWLSSREASILAVTITVLFPLTLLKDLSALQYSSYVGIAAVIYTVLFMAWRFWDGSYAKGGAFFAAIAPELRPRPAHFGPWKMSVGTAILFSMFSTSYMAHTNAVKFYNELEGRSVRRFWQVVAGAMGSATVIYLAAMTLGFETFGLASQGLVLNNYHVSQDVLATMGRIATAVSIIGAHPLLFSGLRDSFLSILPPNVVSRPSTWLLSTIVLLGGATCISLLCKDVGLLVSLVGSSLGAAIVYVFPPFMYLHLLRRRKDIHTSRGEILLLHATILFGVVSGCFGTWVALTGGGGGK